MADFFYVKYNYKISEMKKIKQCVPQGCVLSPIFFNKYIGKMPITENDVKLTIYADNITLTTSNKPVIELKVQIDPYFNQL